MIGQMEGVSQTIDIDQAVRDLVSSEHAPFGSLVNTPLMFPSGGSVVIQVTGSNDSYFVSDMGLAFNEAEMMGASPRLFHDQAMPIAEESGISFDAQSFFVVRATSRQLIGAIKAVANSALHAVHAVSFKLASKQHEDRINIFERLVSIFGQNSVEQDAKIAGVSTHLWPVRARVETDGKVSLFETASKSHLSVVNVAAKFHDIARLDDAPTRITVVRSKKSLGNYISVLSQASNVVETTISDERIVRLAAA